MAMAGNVTFGDGVQLTCPASSRFLDMYGGLYGGGSYAVSSYLCDSIGGEVLVSTLDFWCFSCGDGFYALDHGSSNGAPGWAGVANISCLPCPHGGACVGGGVFSTRGYWGATAAGEVTFAACPPEYCCDGGPVSPCVALDSCATSRTGALCASCKPGFVETFGSAECVAHERCSHEQALAWIVIVLGLLVSAWMQLTLVSGVWLFKGQPTGKFKLIIYFAQVRCVQPEPQCGYDACRVLCCVSCVQLSLCFGYSICRV